MLEYDAKHNNTKVERFFAEFTPIWFNVLGWVALMAGIQVLNSKPKNLFISGGLGFSFVCLLLYFMAIFGRIRFVAPEGTPRRRQIVFAVVSIVLTGLLALASYHVADRAIALLTEIGKP